jgi:radical SAM protein with 4Fe4S-binding SPASM domain
VSSRCEYEDSLALRLHRTAEENCIPLYATIELTTACNLSCSHCYNHDRGSPAPSKDEPFLSREELFRVIDELAQAGTLFLLLTGGEPTLLPYLAEIIDYSRDRNFLIRLKTNGTGLTPEYLRALAKAGLSDIEISLYGGQASTHDRFTGVSGSFAKTCQGIEAAIKQGFKVRISYLIHRDSCNELAEALTYSTTVGAICHVSTELTARLDGSSAPHRHRLTAEQFQTLLDGPYSKLFSSDNPEGELRCSCARSVVAISSTGDVYPCIGAPIPSGNIRKMSFAEIWKSSAALENIRSLKLDDFPACAPCPDRFYCQRSSGAIYCDTGNYTGAEPYTCMEARLRHQHHLRYSGQAR